MSNLSQVKVGSTTYDLRDYHKTGVYFVRGSHTTNTNDWEGTLAGVSELYDGLTIAYYLNRMGEGNATLNLTLANNTTTGKINCYLGETRLSTQYIPGMIIFLTYLASSNRWAAATDTTYSDFTGATASAAGAHGLVPQPASGSNTKYLKGNGSWDAVDGDDVSVSITGTYINGTPVLNSALATLDGAIATVNGQLTGKQDKFANQSANKVFAGPSSGNAATPSFRSLVAADIPGLAASKITSGTLATARGGVPTGGTIGQVLTKTSNADNALEWTTPSSIENLEAPLTLKDSSLTIGTTPTANAYPKELIFTDSTDRELGYLQVNNQTNQWAFTVGASLPDDSSQNQITLGYNRSDNTPFTYVSQSTAFRNAIKAAASSHNHAASDITSGVLATARGGVPTGGTAGQILAKASGTDYDTEWITNSGAGNYLPISGGTLTGQLEIPDSAVADASQTPSADQYGSALYVTDQQGEQVGYLGLVHETNDKLWTQLGVTRDVNGSPAYNSMWLGLKDDGTPTVYFGGSAAQKAWQKALNVLPLSGGEMTGELNIRHNNIDNKQTNNGISADTWPVDVTGIDKNGLRTSFFGEGVYADGDVAAGIFSYNHDATGAQVSTNYLTVGSRKDGTRYFTVGDKAAFLTALGIGTVKELDVSSSISVATSTNKSLGSLTLEAGKWVVEYGTFFSSASSGIACTFLFTSKDVGANAYWYRATCVQTAVSGSNTWHQGSTILNLTASTTVYLTVWHNTDSAKNCQGQMRAIKVG